MLQPKGSVALNGHDQQATPDVRAPSRSWSLAFCAPPVIPRAFCCALRRPRRTIVRIGGARLNSR
jgi:hypothetical protein